MSTRALLRRIALGLPLVGLPAASAALALSMGCSCGGGCQPTRTVTRTITVEQRMELVAMSGGALCAALCDGQTLDGSVGDAGTVSSSAGWTCGGTGTNLVCTEQVTCRGGRAPAGLLATGSSGEGVGGFFARMAHLERAAIPAFAELGHELTLHGAPRRLIRAAARATRDERRHARDVARLATRFGGVVPAVERTASEPRSLFAMADDNAFEGCVREAYGAVVAAYQAVRAADPDVRAVHVEIAKDEARHALLSLALHDWVKTQLSPAEARRIDETRARGIHRVVEEAAQEPGDDVLAFAGVPTAAVAQELASRLA